MGINKLQLLAVTGMNFRKHNIEGMQESLSAHCIFPFIWNLKRDKTQLWGPVSLVVTLRKLCLGQAGRSPRGVGHILFHDMSALFYENWLRYYGVCNFLHVCYSWTQFMRKGKQHSLTYFNKFLNFRKFQERHLRKWKMTNVYIIVHLLL